MGESDSLASLATRGLALSEVFLFRDGLTRGCRRSCDRL